MDKNEFELECEMIKSKFNLDEVIEFITIHDVQIIRGGDYQYGAYIDGDCYYNALTSIGAMWFGMKVFKKLNR